MKARRTEGAPRSARRRVGALVSVAALAGALCTSLAVGGGGAAASVRTHSTTLTTLKLAEVPYYEYAATELGQVKGIFAHYGLKIELEPAGSVTVILAELHSGQDQLGFVTTSLLVNGDEKGEGVKCVAPLETKNIIIPGYPVTAIWVAANSSITSLKQLDGKTLALNEIGGSDELLVKAAVESAGGNFTSIHLTSVPYPDMAAALKSGAIQAGFEGPPYSTIGVKDGDIKLLATVTHFTIGITTQCYMVTDSYFSSHKSLLERFVQAQDQSILYAKAHPSLANKEIGPVSGLTAAQAKDEVPPKLVYTDNLNASSILKFELFMKKYGYLDGSVLPLSQLAWVAPGTPMATLYFNTAGKYTGPATAS